LDASSAVADGAGVAQAVAQPDLVPLSFADVTAEEARARILRSSLAASAWAGRVCRRSGPAWQLAPFPEGRLDESEQPLDLSAQNSWSRRLGEARPRVSLNRLSVHRPCDNHSYEPR
jgi:hypothetical protein